MYVAVFWAVIFFIAFLMSSKAHYYPDCKAATSKLDQIWFEMVIPPSAKDIYWSYNDDTMEYLLLFRFSPKDRGFVVHECKEIPRQKVLIKVELPDIRDGCGCGCGCGRKGMRWPKELRLSHEEMNKDRYTFYSCKHPQSKSTRPLTWQ